MQQSFDLTDEKEAKEYLRAVEIEYQFQCLDQKEADGCHRLAEFKENVKNNITEALPLYKDNCENNKYPRSCYKYGQCLLTGKGLPDNRPDFSNALKYYEKSCDLGVGAGCFNAAQLRLREDVGDGKSIDQAMNLFNKACDLKDSESCFRLSTYFLTGTHMKKNLKRAYELSRKGCELGNIRACSNLSLMYRNGHGTEKNLVLAEEAKKRVRQLSLEGIRKQPNLKVNQ